MSHIFPAPFRALTLSAVLRLGVALLAYVVTARLYGPADFGLRATFMGLSSLLIQSATLGYDMALPVPDSDRKAQVLLAGSFWTVVLLSLVSLALPALLLPIAGYDVRIPGAAWMLGMAVFLGGIGKRLGYWAIRTNELHLISQSKMAFTAVKSGLEILLGLFSPTVGALLIAYLSGLFAQNWPFRSLSRIEFKPWVLGKWQEVRDVLWEYRSFVFFALPALLLSILIAYFPVFFLTRFQSLEAAGQFSLALAIISMGTTVLADTYSTYFMAQLSGSDTNPDIVRNLIRDSIRFTLLTSMVLIGGSFWLAKPVLLLLVGEKWQPAIDVLPLTALLFPAYILQALSAHYLNYFGRNGLLLGFQIIKILALLAFPVFHTRFQTIAAFSTAFFVLLNVLTTIQFFLSVYLPFGTQRQSRP